jgi:hypothetical protein
MHGKRKTLITAFVIIGMLDLWYPSDSMSIRTQMGNASHIRVKGNSATMYVDKNYLVTQSRGPVGSDGIPTEIRLGDVVQVKDKRINVKHIFGTRHLERAQYGKEILAEEGEVSCVLVETPEDLPYSDDYRNRLWITVKQCEVLKELGSSR